MAQSNSVGRATATVLPIRSIPAKTDIPPEAPKYFKDFQSAMSKWTREVEQAVKKLGDAVDSLNTDVAALKAPAASTSETGKTANIGT